MTVASRPEATVEKTGAEVAGVIVSQNVPEPVAMECAGLRSRATFRYEIVDSLERFEHLPAELKGPGYDSHGLEPASETSTERSLRCVDATVAEPEVRAGRSRPREP